MGRNNDDQLDRLLEEAIDEIRTERIDDAEIDEASARVWQRLSRAAGESVPERTFETIRGCTDYQALIPDHLAGTLGEARSLLLTDHSRECVPCRRALKQARSGRSAAPARVDGRRGASWASPARLSLAAAVVLAALLVVLQLTVGIVPTGEALQVASIDGALYEISSGTTTQVATGDRFDGGERLRTAKSSGAVVELADGSRVEMAPRSEIHVTRRGGDATIHLDRGSVIVEAASQGSGHLFVRTDDCLVSVTGTIFSVNHGTRGSRVSVIEGEVHVDSRSRTEVLHPGDQVTTTPLLGMVPIPQEIAWSQNAELHIALLREVNQLRREIDRELEMPAQRSATRLLDLAPENTVIYIALPNLTDTLAQANELLREKVDESVLLKQWWEENVVATGAEPRITEAIERIREVGGTLGNEIVITLQQPPGSQGPSAPVFLAEVRDPSGFRQALAREAERLNGEAGSRVLGLIDNPFAAEPRAELMFWSEDDVAVAATELEQLRHMASLAGSAAGSTFRSSTFHVSLAEAYRDGTSILFGADLGALLRDQVQGHDREMMGALGLDNVEHVIIERVAEGENAVTRASLTFEDERRGVASWLASPAPMGALDFVSADASVVAAAVMRSPSALLGELFVSLGEAEEGFSDELARVQQELDIDLIDDVAGPLGGEMVVALDGPVLPIPAWKIVVEVYDQAALERTLGWAVDRVNTLAAESGKQADVTLTREEVGGRVYHTIGGMGLDSLVHFTFVDGYMVIAPQRALLDRAIQYQRSGYTISDAPAFTALLPAGREPNFSAVVYQNLAPVLEPVLDSGLAQSAPLSPQQRGLVESFVRNAEPSLFYAYGETDRIVLGGTSKGGLLTSDFGGAFGLSTLMSLPGIIDATAGAADAYHGVH